MKQPTVESGKGEIGRVGVTDDFLPPRDRLTPSEDESDYRLTDEQADEVRRRRADQNAPKLTLGEIKERLAIKE